MRTFARFITVYTVAIITLGLNISYAEKNVSDSEKDEVVILGNDNFDKFLSDHKVSMVKFYAPCKFFILLLTSFKYFLIQV